MKMKMKVKFKSSNQRLNRKRIGYVEEDGWYTILAAKDKSNARNYPNCAFRLRLLKNDTLLKHYCYVPANYSPGTNLSMLLQLGKNKDDWLKKQIEIKIDSKNFRHIVAVKNQPNLAILTQKPRTLDSFCKKDRR